MLFSTRIYFKDWWVRGSLAGGMLAQGIMWWLGVSRLKVFTEQIFLHYNSIFGVDLVGQWQKILYIPLLGFGILIINGLFAFVIYTSERFLARLLLLGASVCQMLFLVSLWLLVGLNS